MKKGIRRLTLLAAALLVLLSAACARPEELEEESGHLLYFLSPEGTARGGDAITGVRVDLHLPEDAGPTEEAAAVVEGLILNNKKTGEDFQISVSGVFAAIGQVPENQAFAGLVRLDDSGFIAASEDCVTSCPGIFAAGDCRTKEVRQLTTAAADGAVAALAACKYISRQEIAE